MDTLTRVLTPPSGPTWGPAPEAPPLAYTGGGYYEEPAAANPYPPGYLSSRAKQIAPVLDEAIETALAPKNRLWLYLGGAAVAGLGIYLLTRKKSAGGPLG